MQVYIYIAVGYTFTRGWIWSFPFIDVHRCSEHPPWMKSSFSEGQTIRFPQTSVSFPRSWSWSTSTRPLWSLVDSVATCSWNPHSLVLELQFWLKIHSFVAYSGSMGNSRLLANENLTSKPYEPGGFDPNQPGAPPAPAPQVRFFGERFWWGGFCCFRSAKTDFLVKHMIWYA